MVHIKSYEPERIFPIFEKGRETHPKHQVVSMKITSSGSAYQKT